MPCSITQLTIFISGTSETEAEKAALEKIISELNSLLEPTKLITLKIKRWPNDFRPGVGTEPQEVISKQIKDKYDIYLGILSNRFGTPTKKAGSGTEEEFEQAMQEFLKDTTKLRIMFYFKKNNQDQFNIEIEQFKKVIDFRKRITDRGVLYKDFNDTIEFVNFVREDIRSLIVEEWLDDKWQKVELQEMGNLPSQELLKEQVLKSSNNDTDLEDLGYLDLIAELMETTDSLTQNFTELTSSTKHIGNTFSLHSKNLINLSAEREKELRIGGSRQVQLFTSKAKSIIDQAANDLEEYTNHIIPNLANFKKEMSIILTDYREILEFEQKEIKLPAEKIAEKVQSLKGMLVEMNSAKENMSFFQETISTLPALTKKFKIARKHASNTLGQFVADIIFSVNDGMAIISHFENR